MKTSQKMKVNFWKFKNFHEFWGYQLQIFFGNKFYSKVIPFPKNEVDNFIFSEKIQFFPNFFSSFWAIPPFFAHFEQLFFWKMGCEVANFKKQFFEKNFIVMLKQRWRKVQYKTDIVRFFYIFWDLISLSLLIIFSRLGDKKTSILTKLFEKKKV